MISNLHTHWARLILIVLLPVILISCNLPSNEYAESESIAAEIVESSEPTSASKPSAAGDLEMPLPLEMPTLTPDPEEIDLASGAGQMDNEVATGEHPTPPVEEEPIILEIVESAAVETDDGKVAIFGEIRNNTEIPVIPEATYVALLHPDGTRPSSATGLHDYTMYDLLLQPNESTPFLFIASIPEEGWAGHAVEFVGSPDVHPMSQRTQRLQIEIRTLDLKNNPFLGDEVAVDIKNTDEWSATSVWIWALLYGREGELIGISRGSDAFLLRGNHASVNIPIFAVGGQVESLELHVFAEVDWTRAAEPPFDPREVLEIGNINLFTFMENAYFLWGEVQNNSDQTIEQLGLEIQFLDANGKVVNTRPLLMHSNTLPPKGIAPFSGQWDTSIQEQWNDFIIAPSGYPADEPTRWTVDFQVDTMEIGGWLGNEISGVLMNSGDGDVTNVYLYLTTYDNEGKVNGYGETRIGDMASGEGTPFEAQAILSLATVAGPGADGTAVADYRVTVIGERVDDQSTVFGSDDDSIAEPLAFKVLQADTDASRWDYKISGILEVVDDWYATGVTLYLTVYDSEGKVIGEGQKRLWPDSLAPGDLMPFEIRLTGVDGEHIVDYQLALFGKVPEVSQRGGPAKEAPVANE